MGSKDPGYWRSFALAARSRLRNILNFLRDNLKNHVNVPFECILRLRSVVRIVLFPQQFYNQYRWVPDSILVRGVKNIVPEYFFWRTSFLVVLVCFHAPLDRIWWFEEHLKTQKRMQIQDPRYIEHFSQVRADVQALSSQQDFYLIWFIIACTISSWRVKVCSMEGCSVCRVFIKRQFKQSISVI